MNEILCWEEIEKLYDKEWIELVDYDWPDADPHPKSGRVRVHARERRQFDKLAGINPPTHSAFVFVGIPDFATNALLQSFREIRVKNA